jgi:Fur family ferric uptake transcriptional regulator
MQYLCNSVANSAIIAPMSIPHTTVRLDRFEAYLRDQNMSRTKPRRLVYKALASNGPQTPSVLVLNLKGLTDRATVYRTIEFFLANRIAVRVGDGEIELGEAFRPHHHHLVCNLCGRSESVDDTVLETALREAAIRQGFILESHQVELTGLCATCQAIQ